MFFKRISVLERENKSLQDENKFLKMENEKLKGEDSNKTYAAKFDVKNSQRESKPCKSRAEIFEPSRAAQNSTLNEAVGYARGPTTGRGQFPRYTEFSKEFAEEPEQWNRQQNLNTVHSLEQSSFSTRKINASQWQVPRETSRVQPLLSNQITTRNYFGTLDDCDTVTRDPECEESDRIVAPGELEYAEHVNMLQKLKVVPESTNSFQGSEFSRNNENNTANQPYKTSQPNKVPKSLDHDHQRIHGERFPTNSVPREDLSHHGLVIDRASPKSSNHQLPRVVRTRDRSAAATTLIENYEDKSNRMPTTESDQVRRPKNVVPGEWSYAEAVQQQREFPRAPLGLQENGIWGQDSQQRSHARESHWPGKQRNDFGHSSFQGKSRSQGYRDSIEHKPEIAIVGDSIVGSIRRKDINTETKDHFVTVKTFKGATVDEMDSYIIPTIKKQPDGLILHCGTNNLRKDDPDIIASKVLSLAIEAKRRIPHVAVSSLIARGDSDIMEERRNHVNQILERSLAPYHICFIKHNNIDFDWRDCLWKDGIHLSDHGSAKFTGNFVRFLNNP